MIVALVAAACGSSGGGSSASAAINGASGSGSGASGQGGGSQPGGGASGDLCSVLTDDQVAAAVGASLGKGVPQNDGQMCLWQDETNGQADISIETGGATFDGMCGIAGSGIVKVDGVGDRACFVEAGKLATLLEFEKGGQLYTMHVVLPNGTVAAIEAAEKTLAQEAAVKL